MNWSTMSRLTSISPVHISPAIFKAEAYILRQQDTYKMCLLRNVVLFHVCNYSIESHIVLYIFSLIISALIELSFFLTLDNL